MKIKIVLIDNDKNYLEKITKGLNVHFSDNLELYIFTSKEKLLQSLILNEVHIIIANRNVLNFKEIEDIKIGKVYFCESKDVEKIDGYKAINKFQKIDTIYREINDTYLEIYNTSFKKTQQSTFSKNCRLITYTSFCGGTGTSIVAMSEAITDAVNGKKVLYLNLEYFDSTKAYFECDGSKTFSNVIFEVKKRSDNLADRLQLFLKKDSSGVYYYNPSTILLDKLEINNKKDIEILLNALKKNDFDKIIIDKNINFSEEEKTIFDVSDELRFVVDGSIMTNKKFLSLMNALALLDEKNNTNFCQKISIIYNKMSSSNNITVDKKTMKVLATINKYQVTDNKILINEIVSNQLLKGL